MEMTETLALLALKALLERKDSQEHRGSQEQEFQVPQALKGRWDMTEKMEKLGLPAL